MLSAMLDLRGAANVNRMSNPTPNTTRAFARCAPTVRCGRPACGNRSACRSSSRRYGRRAADGRGDTWSALGSSHRRRCFRRSVAIRGRRHAPSATELLGAGPTHAANAAPEGRQAVCTPPPKLSTPPDACELENASCCAIQLSVHKSWRVQGRTLSTSIQC